MPSGRGHGRVSRVMAMEVAGGLRAARRWSFSHAAFALAGHTNSTVMTVRSKSYVCWYSRCGHGSGLSVTSGRGSCATRRSVKVQRRGHFAGVSSGRGVCRRRSYNCCYLGARLLPVCLQIVVSASGGLTAASPNGRTVKSSFSLAQRCRRCGFYSAFAVSLSAL